VLDIELSRSKVAPRRARELLSDAYGSELGEEALQKALLLASELVSNAVRHGRGKITLRADLDENRLLVEVIDEGRGLEHVIREREFENVEGWGLRLVDSESSRWGAHEGTTHVWFEVERPGPRLGAEENPLEQK
jgi:anti-sigma regulatory factor (Ser/Thr protein kinase)